MTNSVIPELRIRVVNQSPVRGDRSFVVYWMTTSRRSSSNFALDRAAEWSQHLKLPLVVLEALRSDYPWASDRLHRFIVEGMSDNRDAFARRPVTYYPYVESRRGHGRGLLEALGGRAAVVVTDDYPTFFIPRMIEAAGGKLDVRLEAVDSNGLIPMAALDRAYPTAYSLRRTIQKTIADHLGHFPLDDPCDELPQPSPLPTEITHRWEPADLDSLRSKPEAMANIPIDHNVESVAVIGGSGAARARLRNFIDAILPGYGETRNLPEEEGSSGLSPYLHFGHIATHDVFRELMLDQGWTPEDTVGPANGRREGWWGVRPEAEAFLDQFVTWRELGFNVCFHRPDHDRWSSLPDWAQETLENHAADQRDHVYSLEEFDQGLTHDDLWNAAQNQLRRDGVMHNYLRMLWGKKILHWTAHPHDALEIMFELNNRYALDGRDPNSATGIMWVLGRHDRPWGPERPIFGKIRYMSSANTRRKFPVKAYVEKYS